MYFTLILSQANEKWRIKIIRAKSPFWVGKGGRNISECKTEPSFLEARILLNKTVAIITFSASILSPKSKTEV